MIGAVLLAALVVVLARTRSWRTVFMVVLALLTLAEIVHVIGLWGGSTASTGTKLGESAYSLAGILLGLVGLGWMWRKGAESAVPLVLVAAIFLFVAGGMADVTTLGNSQIPSTLPDGGGAPPGRGDARVGRGPGPRRRAAVAADDAGGTGTATAPSRVTS